MHMRACYTHSRNHSTVQNIFRTTVGHSCDTRLCSHILTEKSTAQHACRARIDRPTHLAKAETLLRQRGHHNAACAASETPAASRRSHRSRGRRKESSILEPAATATTTLKAETMVTVLAANAAKLAKASSEASLVTRLRSAAPACRTAGRTLISLTFCQASAARSTMSLRGGARSRRSSRARRGLERRSRPHPPVALKGDRWNTGKGRFYYTTVPPSLLAR